MNRQRGAISILAAATMVVAILAVALALDIGRIVHERQRLQGAVDAAALAGARALAIENNPAGVATAAQAAARENGYTGTLIVTPGHTETGTTGPDSGIRKFVAGPGSWYNAVQVEATRSVPRSLFAGGLLPGTTNITTRAVAFRESVATFQLGTALAELDTRESELLNMVLGGMLGANLDLDVLDYRALVGAIVTLGELVAQLDLGTAEALLDETITLGELVTQSITILERRGDAESHAAALALNDHMLSLPGNIRLADVLSVSTDAAALDAAVNVFDLIMAAAQLATSKDAAGVQIDLGDALSPLGLGGVAGLGLTLTIKVGQPPKIAVGPPGPPGCGPDDCYTTAESAQLELGVTASVLNLINLNIDVDGAGGKAWLEALEPPTPSSPARVRVGAETEAAHVALSGSITINLPLLGKLNLPLLEVNADVGGREFQQTFSGPFPSSTGSSTTTSDFNGLKLSVSLGLLDALGVTALVNGLLNSLTSNLLSPLLENLLSPLTKLLGLQIADADVTVLHASAGEVRLVQ